ncbi:MAG: HAD hydrolase family protein [candidate division NC10 bacterium]|nr:HAD hydrolase family protein [candidate division NC10 bacterium]
MLILDVDGVLTDGCLLYGSGGTELKAFHVQDGFGLRAAQRMGLIPAIITGRDSDVVSRRAQELGIVEVHQGAIDKVRVYCDLLARHGLQDEMVAFMGDDLVDLPILGRVGLSLAPASAHPEVKARVDYVSQKGGGQGAVREVVELILKAQGRWEAIIERYLAVEKLKP